MEEAQKKIGGGGEKKSIFLSFVITCLKSFVFEPRFPWRLQKANLSAIMKSLAVKFGNRLQKATNHLQLKSLFRYDDNKISLLCIFYTSEFEISFSRVFLESNYFLALHSANENHLKLMSSTFCLLVYYLLFL